MRERYLIAGMMMATLVLSSGCISAAGDLPGTSWILIAYADDHGHMVEADHATTFRFREDGMVSGIIACNSYTAEYRETGDQLVFGQAVITEIDCSNGYEGDGEVHIISLLSRVRSYRITGDILVMFGARGEELLAAGRTI